MSSRKIPTKALVATTLFLLVTTLFTLVSTARAYADAPSVPAASAILIDATNGEIIYAKNGDNRRPMASTTKIMTALVVIESLRMDDKVTVSSKAASVEGSQMHLKWGDVLTVRQLMNALLIKSANDAAVALAEASAGSVEKFVEKMNAKAKALNLDHTHFVNPHGLDSPEHYSSARDMAVLASYALSNPDFGRIVDTRQYTLSWSDNGHTTFNNTNRLLSEVDWANGVKTGTTSKAGSCLVSSGSKSGRQLVAVILGANSGVSAAQQSKALLEYGFASFQKSVLAEKGEVVSEVPVPQLGDSLQLVASQSVEAVVLKQQKVEQSVELKEKVEFPVEVGDVYGTLNFKVGERVIGSVDLVSARTFQTPSPRVILGKWQEPWVTTALSGPGVLASETNNAG